MIKVISAIAILVVASGCQLPSRSTRREARVDSALPMTMSRSELVKYLNKQSGNLQAWESNQVRMKVCMPRMPDQRLMGSIACESPNRFHLLAGIDHRDAAVDVRLGDWILLHKSVAAKHL